MKIFFWFILFINFASTVFSQGLIRGRIINEQTGKPLSGANVYLLEQQKGKVTDTLGYYQMSNLPQGKFKIQFSYIGYQTVVKTIQLSGDTVFLDVGLKPTSILSQGVVISGGAYSAQHENAIKIEKIDRRALKNNSTLSLFEGIANVPGVDVIQKGPGVSKPVIRGLSMNNILMLSDGVRMENYQFSENHPFLINQYGVDNVEIIKGPASLLYGSDAVGGVINVLREKPAATGKINGDYHFQYHSNTKGVVTNLGIKGNKNDIFWGVRGGGKSHADYYSGRNEFVPNTRFNEKSMKLYAGLIRPFGTMRINYDYLKPEYGMCVNNSVAKINERGRKNEIWYQDLANHMLAFHNKFFAGDYKLDANIAYQRNNRKLQTDTSMPAVEMVDMHLDVISYEVKTYLPSGKNSDYIIGFSGINKKTKNVDAPNHILPDAGVDDLAFFSLLQHRFFKKLMVQAGLRYDFRWIKTKAETNKTPIKNQYDNYSISTGMTYNFSETLLLRSNIASAYRTPNLAELSQDGIHGVRYEQGNADLLSQRNYEFDLSMHYHSSCIKADIAAYANYIDHYIFLAPTSDSINDKRVYRYAQTDAQLFGGEAGLTICPGNAFNFETDYSHIYGVRKNGMALPFIPHNKFRFRVIYNKNDVAFFTKINFSAEFIYAFKQNNPAQFETITPAYELVNLKAGIRLPINKQKATVSIHLNNIFNKVYYDHLSTLKQMGYLNMGRNITLNFLLFLR